MSKYDIENDDNSYVLVGTPLASLIPDDAKFTSKPKRPEEQIVTDEKGRQRFHGAFTGGFSAGYFNSVGTKEGWTPNTFKSSRSDRNNAGNQQRPEDFMDDEDFSEHGIAPKTLSIKTDFKDKSMSDKTTSRKNNVLFFDDLIKPVRSTIGVRMLKKMGWREGQGVGPKIKRKLRKLKAKKVHEPGRKIYGVTLPTANEISDLEDEALSEDDDYLVSLYDVNEFRFEIKEDQFGLGYKRLDVNEIFSGSNKIGAIPADSNASVADLLFPGMVGKNAKKRSITGHAFGVGEFEDEDDADLYKADTLENYDFDLDAKCEKEKKAILDKSYGFGAFENDILVLRKFQRMSKKQEPAKVFKAPEVPKDFNLMHKFDTVLTLGSGTAASGKPADDAMNVYLKTASERGEVLGETFIPPNSVFDLMSQADKDRIAQVKLKQNLSMIASESIKQTVAEAVKLPASESVIVKQKTAEEKANEAKLAKQKRYEQYIAYVKRNYKDPYSFIEALDLTEWEKEHEKEEFSKMYQNQAKKIEEYRSKMNSKFQSKNVLIKTGDEIVENPIEPEKVTESETEKAVREKKYGKLTRTEYEWRPHNIVCKRFNVPNPYPDAKEYGTVGNQPTKRATFRDEKFSIFDVLVQQNKFETKATEVIDKTGNLVTKAPVIVNKKDLTSNEMKIEFETKSAGASEATAEEGEVSIEKEKTAEEDNGTLNRNNVYLQERPSIDIFKAIFDADDEENDKNGQEKEPEKDESEEEQSEDVVMLDEEEPVLILKPAVPAKQTTESNSSIEIIPSSLSSIDYSKLNQYLRKEDLVEKKIENDFFDPKEYEQKTLQESKKARAEDVYGPKIVAPVLFKPRTREVYRSQEEVIQIDSSSSDNSSVEFVEKTGDAKSESDSEGKNHKKKKKKKKSKKKSHSKKHSKNKK